MQIGTIIVLIYVQFVLKDKIFYHSQYIFSIMLYIRSCVIFWFDIWLLEPFTLYTMCFSFRKGLTAAWMPQLNFGYHRVSVCLYHQEQLKNSSYLLTPVFTVFTLVFMHYEMKMRTVPAGTQLGTTYQAPGGNDFEGARLYMYAF